jgi:hypothetical protein
MATTAFYKGQLLGRNDLNIYLTNVNGTPVNAAEISYALYDFTTGSEVLVGPSMRVPVNPSVGEYYASLLIPLDANIGAYRIRWTFREVVGGPLQQVVMNFAVIDRVQPGGFGPGGGEGGEMDHHERELMRRLRNLLRDNNPDRNYHFRPPAHEETVTQFSKVFGFIWEDHELVEYMYNALDDIIAAPPKTPFANIAQMVQLHPEWRTMLLTGATYYALQAMRINWIADEFDYSIGGVSLNLEKAAKYEGAQQAASEHFQTQLEKGKATVNYIKGVQQPKFGTGIRSAFGPYAGRGVLSPRKFVGF